MIIDILSLHTMGWAQIYEPYFLRSRAHAKKSVVIHSVAFIEIIEGDLNWTRKGPGSTLRSTKKSIWKRPWGCLNDKICVCVFTKAQNCIVEQNCMAEACFSLCLAMQPWNITLSNTLCFKHFSNQSWFLLTEVGHWTLLIKKLVHDDSIVIPCFSLKTSA